MTVNVVDDVWRQRYLDRRQQTWLRVTAYCEAHARPTGHCPLTTGELARALNVDGQQVSRGIASAIRQGWLDAASSARCLVLARANPNAPCPAIHREGR